MVIRLNKQNYSMLAAMFLMLLPQVCHANANNYVLSRVLNVGLLRIPSAGQSGPSPAGTLPAPYMFDILANRPGVIPALWRLQNPLAPTIVTGQIASRFPSGGYTTDQQVTPNMAPYWEVDLAQVTSSAQISQYNLLVICVDISSTGSPGLINFTITERKLLRQYVDQGGTLWIDVYAPIASGGSATSDPSDPFLDSSYLFRADFTGTTPTSLTSNALLEAVQHPVASSPYTYSTQTLANLGYQVADLGASSPSCYSLASAPGSTTAPDTTLFQQLGPSLIAGDYGSGHVIIDGLGIGDAINDETPGATSPQNMGGTDQTNYIGSATADLQFLVNVLSYSSTAGTPGGNVRGNNTQGANFSGGLTASWQSFFGQSDAAVGIATYGKFVFTTDQNGLLDCFDINPAESLFPNDAVGGDDGITDYSNGSSYDLIWLNEFQNKSISQPVVALMPVQQSDGSTLNQEVVMVEDGSGTVWGYDATHDPGPSNIPIGTSNLLFKLNSSETFTYPPPAPTYYRGQILAPQANGNLNIFNAPSTGFTNTSTPDSSFSVFTSTEQWTQPVMVASVPSTDSKNYNGNEIVAYCVSGTAVQSLILGSRDEQIQYVSPQGGVPFTGNPTTFSTHASYGMTSTDSLVGSFEDTFAASNDGSWILDFGGDNAGNIFNFAAVSPATAEKVTVPTGPADTLYADYNIVTGSTEPTRTMVPAALADGNGGSNAIQGAAIGPDNILYVTVNEPGTGGAGSGYIEAINDQNPNDSQSTILWRFELTGGETTPAQSSASSTYTVEDADGITYDFFGYQFVGAPIVGNNGVVYALVQNTTTTTTRLMAFNTTPQVGFVDPFAPNSSPGQQYTVTVSQTDEFGSLAQSIPPSQYNAGQFTNFSSSNQTTLAPDLFAPGSVSVVQLLNGVATGLPVTVTIDTAAQQASPMLLWYTSLPSLPTSPGRLLGDYIYFGAQAPASGATAAIDGTVAIYANPSAIGLTPDPATRYIAQTYTDPNNAAVTEVTDYRFIHVLPTRIGAVNIPPVGSDKYMVTGGLLGFEGLSYNSILVADSNRLIELDPDGNATLSLDSTQQSTYSTASSAGGIETLSQPQSSVSLNRPSTVTQLNTNDFLIADSGNNRVVHVDRTGTVLTQLTDSNGYVLVPTSSGVARSLEITSFSDPLGILPVGQPATLNAPNGVVTWLTYEYPNGIIGAPPPTYINAHYLIADTGNNRILDIVDRYQEVGTSNEYSISNAADYHYLNWISHTSDVGNRLYQYVEAEPILNTSSQSGASAVYPDVTTPGSADVDINQATGIIGVVGDKNIPALTNGTASPTPSNLTAVDQDSKGSSILLLIYSSGYQYSAMSGTNGYQSGLPIELINSVAYGAASQNTVPLPLRGLRSAIATSYSINPPGFSDFVIADDDGVFNGRVTNTTSTNLSNTNNAAATAPTPVNGYPYTLDATYGAAHNTSTFEGWSFQTQDYVNAVAAYDKQLASSLGLTGTATNVQNYQNTPFVAASAIELVGNNYLIVNRGAAGNPNSPTLIGSADNGFGGDVFSVHETSATLSSGGTAILNPPTSTLDGPIYGHPANTGPLLAPSFALRAN